MGRLVTLGVPVLAAEQTGAAAAALAAVLERRLGTPVTVAVADSYSELEDDVADGEVDFAWLPPYEAAQLAAGVGVAPLLRALRGGRLEYHATLFVRADSPLVRLDDLQGKRVGFVHRRSASGYLVPAAYLVEHGIDFGAPLFLGSHEGVVEAVVAGRADAGATYATVSDATASPPVIASASWHQLPKVAADLRPLAVMGPIPSDTICAWPGTNPSLRRQLTQAILAAGDDSADAAVLTALFGTAAFAPADEAAFDHLNRAVTTLARRRRP
jgi:phosphonate transport system substrate-binding protein